VAVEEIEDDFGGGVLLQLQDHTDPLPAGFIPQVLNTIQFLGLHIFGDGILISVLANGTWIVTVCPKFGSP
jgi:hypothetical protein